MPFPGGDAGNGDLVENRIAKGRFFEGLCAAWFRQRHPLVCGEAQSPHLRVAVAGDSGNGITLLSLVGLLLRNLAASVVVHAALLVVLFQLLFSTHALPLRDEIRARGCQ
jgi:hypothetical protein